MLKKALILVLFGPGCIFAQGTPKPTPSAQVQSSGKTQRLHPAPPGEASSIASSSKTVEGPPKRLTSNSNHHRHTHESYPAAVPRRKRHLVVRIGSVLLWYVCLLYRNSTSFVGRLS